MPLVIEDGSIVAGANSYVTVAELNAFATQRGYTLPATDAEKEVLITKGADYTQSFRSRFQGEKVAGDQPLQFPRIGVCVDGFNIAGNAIPIDLKLAQMQAAIEYNAGEDMLPNTGPNIKREKTDILETEYQDGDGALVTPTFPKVDQYLNSLLRNSAGQSFVMSYR